MSAHEWKSGDVALVDYGTGVEVMMREHSGWFSHCTEISDLDAPSVRLLVVIDPEDREQVDRLNDLIWKHVDTAHVDLTAALREFANPTPPKPDEPQGLGAVVVDAEGRRYVRCDTDGSRWHCPDDDTGAHDDFYRNIAAVRVLSEGVTE